MYRQRGEGLYRKRFCQCISDAPKGREEGVTERFKGAGSIAWYYGRQKWRTERGISVIRIGEGESVPLQRGSYSEAAPCTEEKVSSDIFLIMGG